jgi:tetratricopeptide (TPR) repeat protein
MASNRSGVVVPMAWAQFSERGDVAAARPVLEAALAARSPADARVRGLLARLEWFDGRYDRALQLIGEMDESGAWLPANFRFPAALAAAQVYESQGRRADAAASYAAAWELLQRRRKVLGDDFQVEAAMGLTAAGLGRVDEALHHANRAVSLLPITTDAAGGPLYLYLLAQTQARVGRPAEAMATLDRLLRVPGFYTEVWVERDPGFATVRARPEYRARREYWATLKGDALLVARNP